MRKWFVLLGSSLLVLNGRAEEKSPPRLTVVISVDQMRADYLVKFRPYFGPDGFHRLLAGGAYYQNCHYQHAITVTAPGHATILSGVHADVHGIIANEWLDRTTFIQGNAVEDVDSPLVGLPPRAGRYANAVFAAKAGRSPRNFLGTTIGDRLKARYGSAAKVFGVADKDRAAILMSGPKADGAYWTEEGRFVTSTYYRKELPAWVEEFNLRRNAAQYFGQTWDRLLEKSVYDTVQGVDDAPGEQVLAGLPVTLPKKFDGGSPAISDAFYGAFDLAPWANDLVTEFAVQVIEAGQLGRDDIPDLLAVGFSQPDALGHAYGPDSHEIMDTYLRLDRTLAELLRQLEAKVGLAHCLIVLVADHGVSPLPERIQAEQGPAAAGRISPAPFDLRVKAILEQAFGPPPDGGYWAVRDGAVGYRLNSAALQARNIAEPKAEETLKAAILAQPEMAAAYTRAELTTGAPLDTFGEMMRLSYYPPKSPDVMFVPRPFFQFRKSGTGHGTPYEYDTHVPLVWFGAGVKPGVHAESVAVEDLAPTLAGLLGVELPAEAHGKKLF